MLTKESTLKDLVDEVSVNWFKNIVNERVKKLRVEIEELTQQAPMFLQMGGAAGFEVETSIHQIQAEVSVLRNLNDLKAYVAANGFNLNEKIFKNNSFSLESITQFLQKGESMSKMLVKLQLGETFAITDQIIKKIDILDTKIGYEEGLKNITEADLNYLLMKTLDEWEKELLNFITNNAADSENVLEEIRQVINTTEWNEKLKNAEIIERYFSKFKANNLFGDLSSPEDFQDKSNQEQIINYSRMLGSIHSLIFIIKLNINILTEFKKINN